jgi:demethylmenaquinone methyltransferase / 2-methoxy-6-polyprenyl-1,4-benzoquinol methylase
VTDPKAWYVRNLFSKVPSEYDALLTLLTFGQDKRWRALVVRKTGPDSQGIALDVATGTGLLAADFARNLGREGFVVGVDLTLSMLQTARARLADRGYRSNTDWVLARAENLPFKNDCFRSATISLALRNVSDATKTVQEMTRTTVPGGTVVSLDFTRPTNGALRLFYYDYLLGLFPILGRIVSQAWGKTLAYLGRSILRARTGEQVARLMSTVGLSGAESLPLTMGIVCMVYGKKQ